MSVAALFQIPTIGEVRAQLLISKGIKDREAFLKADENTIRPLGAAILKAWRTERVKEKKTTGMTALDINIVKCEQALMKEKKLTPGELPDLMEKMKPGDLPVACRDPAVALGVSANQEQFVWRTYIQGEELFAQGIESKLRMAGNIVTDKEDEKKGETNPYLKKPYRDILGVTKRFFGNKDAWDKLFPAKPGVAPSKAIPIYSDAVAAMLQALTTGRPLPSHAMISSIADQLIELANTQHMEFLRFLAEDYDSDYPGTNGFLLTDIVKDPPDEKQVEYLFKRGVGLVVANMQSFITKKEKLTPKDYVDLWRQVRKESSSDNIDALIAKWNLEGDKLTTLKEIAQALKTTSTQDRATSIFNTFFHFVKKIHRQDVKLDIPVDAEWAKIISREKPPLRVVDAVVNLPAMPVTEDIKPYLIHVRQSINSVTDFTKFLETFTDSKDPNAPVQNKAVIDFVLRKKDLQSEEDWLWFSDMLALDVGRKIIPTAEDWNPPDWLKT